MNTVTPPFHLEPKQCYAALQARDPRFDGVFYVAVSSTKVYCRPICKVRMPKAQNCTFYRNPAAAEQAGYRPCLKCRPELAPGNAKADAVKRVAQSAAERIKAGALTDASLEALASEFNLSSRQLRRAIEAEYGVSPINLAQTYRLLLAKQLLTDTRLKITDIAFASGFSSVRRFNAAFKSQYRLNPSALRSAAIGPTSNTILLRLSYRPPLHWAGLVGFLTSRGGSRVETLHEGRYFRVITLNGITGWIAARDSATNTGVAQSQHYIEVEVSPSLLPHLIKLQAKLRALFDLDANPTAVNICLSKDALLKKLVKKNPGLRVPGAIDGFELTLRAVLGQQISVKAASTLFARFVDAFGDPVQTPIATLDRSAPNPARIAVAELQTIIDLGLTQKRAQTILDLAQATSNGELAWDTGNTAQLLERLRALAGIGPWTVQYVAMRACSDPNAFPESDLGLMKALQLGKPALVLQRAVQWQPWRAYAALHLWQHLNAGG